MTIWRSPAKVNLFLRILGKRSDGYHAIKTLMQTISLSDSLQVDLAKSDVFTCSDLSLPLNQDNLVLKALGLFREKTGWDKPVNIHLEKDIPHQAGLGGGSSNAATTLWALNELSGLGIASQELQTWSENLGSDVPFFFSKGIALCEGRGEKVTVQDSVDLGKLVIVVPPFGLATQDVYAKYLSSESSSDELFTNDLENPAFEVSPELNKLKSKLIQSGFDHVVMSGSGSSLICVGEGNVPTGNQIFSVMPVSRDNAWY